MNFFLSFKATLGPLWSGSGWFHFVSTSDYLEQQLRNHVKNSSEAVCVPSLKDCGMTPHTAGEESGASCVSWLCLCLPSNICQCVILLYPFLLLINAFFSCNFLFWIHLCFLCMCCGFHVPQHVWEVREQRAGVGSLLPPCEPWGMSACDWT